MVEFQFNQGPDPIAAFKQQYRAEMGDVEPKERSSASRFAGRLFAMEQEEYSSIAPPGLHESSKFMPSSVIQDELRQFLMSKKNEPSRLDGLLKNLHIRPTPSQDAFEKQQELLMQHQHQQQIINARRYSEQETGDEEFLEALMQQERERVKRRPSQTPRNFKNTKTARENAHVNIMQQMSAASANRHPQQNYPYSPQQQILMHMQQQQHRQQNIQRRASIVTPADSAALSRFLFANYNHDL